jgi:hypothetical protein
MIAIPVWKFVRGWFLNSFLFRNILIFFYFLKFIFDNSTSKPFKNKKYNLKPKK